MRSVFLLGSAVLTATFLALYGVSATAQPAPAPQTVKSFDGPVLAQTPKPQFGENCRACHTNTHK